ncbi:hypothetical protein DFH08DRAFT_945587 [Mycena albidolilacea]|uniref:Uncharacterized protein n=1 Tax=Mycena albidolilacea TaxID=1033008 RepID=A0AAD7E896_9AGAR|nr:hypothetical protein DFH08DRAFT_945587 [Mycena albidolilacea]
MISGGTENASIAAQSQLLPLLPAYPAGWNVCVNDHKTLNLSRKLNNLFTLTAIAVHDREFMKFGPGLSAGQKFEIPWAWVDATLVGFNWGNPFIKKLQHLKASHRNDNIPLQIEQSDRSTQEIAAIISLVPASPPSRRKLVILRKANDKPIDLDILSPFAEPLHYLLLLPEGTLGWSPLMLPKLRVQVKLSQVHGSCNKVDSSQLFNRNFRP